MKEFPILFSAPMVRAILEGRKTQTRRVITEQPLRPEVAPHCENGWWMWRVWTPENTAHGMPSVRIGDRRCPYGVAGDRLWVRETFHWSQAVLPGKPRRPPMYRADGEAGVPKWTPAIHMPRAACRLELEVTGVRVERLQEISANDAKAEGIDEEDFGPPPESEGFEFDYRAGYQQLWDSLNEKRGFGWSTNPWCWVVEFKRAADIGKVT